MDHEEQKIFFCTFGMFIIDEIEWQTLNPQPTRYDLIGGAGTYAALGARLAVSPLRSLGSSVSWIIDMGVDFPGHLKTIVESWETTCLFREDLSRFTTRAWNGYGSNGWRDFKYLTAKKRLEVASLSLDQVMSKSFHMVCSPERCIDLTRALRQKRAEIRQDGHWPIIVWEPIPDLCSPEELERLRLAAKDCSIVSPNHDELKLFFQDAEYMGQIDLVERLMGWSASAFTKSAAVPIIREGSNGSTAYFRIPPAKKTLRSVTSDSTAIEPYTIAIHVPAYHDDSLAHLVIDPTGGGNTYLGALAISMTDIHIQSVHPNLKCIYKHLGWFEKDKSFNPDHMKHGSDANFVIYNHIRAVLVAMILANIVASFAIEQNGTPELDYSATEQKEHETWNGDTLLMRLSRYLEREAYAIREQMNQIKSVLEGRSSNRTTTGIDRSGP